MARPASGAATKPKSIIRVFDIRFSDLEVLPVRTAGSLFGVVKPREHKLVGEVLAAVRQRAGHPAGISEAPAQATIISFPPMN